MEVAAYNFNAEPQSELGRECEKVEIDSLVIESSMVDSFCCTLWLSCWTWFWNFGLDEGLPLIPLVSDRVNEVGHVISFVTA